MAVILGHFCAANDHVERWAHKGALPSQLNKSSVVETFVFSAHLYTIGKSNLFRGFTKTLKDDNRAFCNDVCVLQPHRNTRIYYYIYGKQ